MPKLSIIIATYNAAATFARCLDSIVCQKFKSYEIIIVDGSSTDATLDIISAYENHIRYWHSRKDNGIYDAWNQAIAHSEGDYICFIGADDFFTDENALENIFNSIGDSEYDLVSSKGIFLQSVTKKRFIVGKPWSFKKLERKITICHPGLLHNRKLFATYGLFNMEYRIVGDYEFLLRLPSTTLAIHVNSPTIYIDDGGISRTKYMDMLIEKRKAQALCPRVGKIKAEFNYYDKLWRIPIAKLLKIPY